MYFWSREGKCTLGLVSEIPLIMSPGLDLVPTQSVFVFCKISPKALSVGRSGEPLLQAYRVNTNGWNKTDRIN